ncbi:unnamed protein product, partial [marine sediment metagenome]
MAQILFIEYKVDNVLDDAFLVTLGSEDGTFG